MAPEGLLVSPISLQTISDAFRASLYTFILSRYSLAVNTVGIMGGEDMEHAASGFWFKIPGRKTGHGETV